MILLFWLKSNMDFINARHYSLLSGSRLYLQGETHLHVFYAQVKHICCCYYTESIVSFYTSKYTFVIQEGSGSNSFAV